MYLNLCSYVFIPSSIQGIILMASTFLVPLFVKILVLFFLMIYPGINVTKLLFLRPINHLAYYVELSVKLTAFRRKSSYIYLLLDQCNIVVLLIFVVTIPASSHRSLREMNKEEPPSIFFQITPLTTSQDLSSLVSCHLCIFLNWMTLYSSLNLSNTHLISLIFWTTLNSILALQDLLNRN